MESSTAEFLLRQFSFRETSRICLDVAGFARILVAAWGYYDSGAQAQQQTSHAVQMLMICFVTHVGESPIAKCHAMATSEEH